MTATQTAARKAAELRDEAARQRATVPPKATTAEVSEEAPRAASSEHGAQSPWNGKTIDQAGNTITLEPPPDPPQRLKFGPQFLDALETAQRLYQ